MQIPVQLAVLLRSRGFQVSLAAGLSFAAGFALSKKVLEEEIEAKWSEISTAEIEQAKRFYKTGEFSDPVKMVEKKYPDEAEDLKEVVKTLKYFSDDDLSSGDVEDEIAKRHSREAATNVGVVVDPDVVAAKVDGPLVVSDEDDSPLVPRQQATEDRIQAEEQADTRRNIWDEATREVSAIEEEATERMLANKPYVVTEADHMEGGGPGFETVSLTYFAPNDLLIDERDEAIENVDRYVGNRNLLLFGFGNAEEDCVHVRNPEYELDIEIIRTHRTYEEETGEGSSDG